MIYEDLLGEGMPFHKVLAFAASAAEAEELEDVEGAAITVRSEALATLRVVDEPFADEVASAPTCMPATAHPSGVRRITKEESIKAYLELTSA